LRLNNPGNLKIQSRVLWDSQSQCLLRSLSPEVYVKREWVGWEQYEGYWKEPGKQQESQKLTALPNPATATPLNKVN
jgi:hypothetical protein